MKDKITNMVDEAIGLLDTIRIDIALKPKREGIDDKASDLNLLLCKIHDSIESLTVEQQTQEGEVKKFLYDKFFYLCKRTKFKEDREFANVNAEGYADEVIEWLQSTPPDNSKEKVSEEEIDELWEKYKTTCFSWVAMNKSGFKAALTKLKQ